MENLYRGATIFQATDSMAPETWLHAEQSGGHMYLGEIAQPNVWQHDYRNSGQEGMPINAHSAPVWTSQVLHEPSSAKATAPIDLDFFSLDSVFNFPYVPTLTGPHEPIFTSHQLVSEFEMLIGSERVAPSGDITQGTFGVIPDSGTDSTTILRNDNLTNSVDMPSYNQQLEGVANGSFGGHQPPLADNGSFSGDALPAFTSTTGRGAMQPSTERHQQRGSIYYIVGRLLDMANSQQ
jgi:hypothetical protein